MCTSREYAWHPQYFPNSRSCLILIVLWVWFREFWISLSSWYVPWCGEFFVCIFGMGIHSYSSPMPMLHEADEFMTRTKLIPPILRSRSWWPWPCVSDYFAQLFVHLEFTVHPKLHSSILSLPQSQNPTLSTSSPCGNPPLLAIQQSHRL